MTHAALNHKNANRLRTSALLFFCFAVPCAILILVYFVYGIAPFGEKSLLIMDMSAQYSEFFLWLEKISMRKTEAFYFLGQKFSEVIMPVFLHIIYPARFLS